jgi:hypothetical protein
MNQRNEVFAGYNCVKLENDALSLWVTQDVGPRIIGLALPGGDNLMAVVPQAAVATPAGNVYQFRGGHRLWYAPETPEQTYVPDDSAVSISPVPNGIQTTQAVEAQTGIEKQMTILLPDSTAQVIIDHKLTNRGQTGAVELAPWAITQLKPGGFAILPQSNQDTGLLPNRRIALWPYSQITSPHLKMGNRYIFVLANMTDEKFKLGWANLDGWLAYWTAHTLFVKHAAYQPDEVYYDFGSSSECYCDERFLELETLGPQALLKPGQTAVHREIWRIYDNVSLTPEESAVDDFFSGKGL